MNRADERNLQRIRFDVPKLIEEDTRPICEACGEHSNFTPHYLNTGQRSMFSEETREQQWFTCDNCGAQTEVVETAITRKPVKNVVSISKRRSA